MDGLEEIQKSFLRDLEIMAPALAPYLMGLVFLLANRFFKGALKKEWARFFALLALSLAGWMELTFAYSGGNGMLLIHDPFARFCNLSALLGLLLFTALTARTTEPKTKVESSSSAVALFGAVLLLAGGIIFLSVAYDLITIFIGLELCALPLYILLYLDLQEKQGKVGSSADPGVLTAHRKRVQNIVGYGVFSSLLLALGLAVIYGLSGATQLIQVRINLSIVFLSFQKIGPALIVAVALIGSGVLARMGLAPFHLWLGKVRETGVSGAIPLALMGGLISGMIAILRLFDNALIGFSDSVMSPLDWPPFLIALLSLTAFLACIASLRERSLGRILLWLALAQTAFSLVGVATYSDTGLSAALFQLFSAVIAIFLAFTILENLQTNQSELTLESLQGLIWRSPFWGAILAIAVASLGAAPFTAGYSARYALAEAALKAEAWWMFTTLVVTSALLFIVALRALIAILVRSGFGRQTAETNLSALSFPASSLSTRLAGAVSVAILIYLGIAPEALHQATEYAARVFAL